MISIQNKYFLGICFSTVLVFCLLSANKVCAVNTPATLSGNDGWSDSGANWAGGGGTSGAPDADDDVIIAAGVTLTMNTNFTTTGAVTITGLGNNTTLTFAGFTLSCGLINIDPGASLMTNTANVGTGTLTCSAISMANNAGTAELRISTGTVTVAGNITLNGAAARNVITFTGAGLLQLGGTLTANKTLTPSTGTVEYTSAGARIITATSALMSYFNLSCSGAGTKTIPSALNVGGNFTIDGCTVNYNGGGMTQVVTGNLIINTGGILDLNQNTATFT